MDLFINYFYCYYTTLNEYFLLVDSFHRFSGEKSGGLHDVSVCGGSSHGEIIWRSLSFSLCLFIYLFIICLFIVCLCVCFLIIFKKVFVGHASIMWFNAVGKGDGGGYFYGIVWRFWWVSSGLFCSPVGLMQDVMKSLPSFLTYCYYCLYLFIL